MASTIPADEWQIKPAGTFFFYPQIKCVQFDGQPATYVSPNVSPALLCAQGDSSLPAQIVASQGLDFHTAGEDSYVGVPPPLGVVEWPPGVLYSGARTRISFWAGNCAFLLPPQCNFAAPFVYAGGFMRSGLLTCTTVTFKSALIEVADANLSLSQSNQPALVPADKFDPAGMAAAPDVAGLSFAAGNDILLQATGSGDRSILFSVGDRALGLHYLGGIYGIRFYGECLALDSVDARSGAVVLPETNGPPDAAVGLPGSMGFSGATGSERLYLKSDTGWQAFALT